MRKQGGNFRLNEKSVCWENFGERKGEGKSCKWRLRRNNGKWILFLIGTVFWVFKVLVIGIHSSDKKEDGAGVADKPLVVLR